jgi:galactose mutarotase-like enzyme
MEKEQKTKPAINPLKTKSYVALDQKVTDDNGLIKLESKSIICKINMNLGGKIYSLKSKNSGREFLFQDTRSAFANKDYSNHDLSGFDECFPTVAPCQFKIGRKNSDLPDHGFLWNQIWDYQIEDNIVRMSCYVNELKSLFERDCIISDDSIRFEYRITNQADCTLPFIYSAHPFLRAENDSLLELPADLEDVFMYISSKNSGFTNQKWIEFKDLQKKQRFSGFDCSKEAFIKCFTNKLSVGKAAMIYPSSKEKFEFGFDAIHLPYLGIFISEGYDSLDDGHFKNKLIIGLEPTTGIGDELVTAKKTGTLNSLEPNRQFRFWISIRYSKMRI